MIEIHAISLPRFCALALVLLVVGCYSGKSNPTRPAAVPVNKEVPAGSEVTVIKQIGNYVKIRLASGEEGYAELEDVTPLQTSKSSQYLVVQPTTILERPPLHDEVLDSPPRPRQEILQDLLECPVGYMAKPGGEIVLVPQNYEGPYRDPESGQWCWPAYVCHAPDCPQAKDGQPYIFPFRDKSVEIDESGTVSSKLPAEQDPAEWFADQGFSSDPLCPACLKIRQRDTETPQQAERYRKLVQPYVPAESQARKRKLLEEYRRLLNAERREQSGE